MVVLLQPQHVLLSWTHRFGSSSYSPYLLIRYHATVLLAERSYFSLFLSREIPDLLDSPLVLHVILIYRIRLFDTNLLLSSLRLLLLFVLVKNSFVMVDFLA